MEQVASPTITLTTLCSSFASGRISLIDSPTNIGILVERTENVEGDEDDMRMEAILIRYGQLCVYTPTLYIFNLPESLELISSRAFAL